MPCPHYDIAIIKRSKGMGAVKSAAYQSAENLYSEYDHKKHYNRSKEKEIFHKEILLPAHAPPEYADRSTLWNAVEKSEKQWNAQVARRIVVPIPREIPKERHVELMREYCMNEFVLRGMVADLAIHDKGDGNPHAHILLTMRGMDEDGKWLPKAKKVYDLDENGERMSVSDVVVLQENGVEKAYYVDSLGFKEVPQFLQQEIQKEHTSSREESRPEAAPVKSIGNETSWEAPVKPERRRDSVLAALRQKQAQTQSASSRQEPARQIDKENRKERGTAL